MTPLYLLVINPEKPVELFSGFFLLSLSPQMHGDAFLLQKIMECLINKGTTQCKITGNLL